MRFLTICSLLFALVFSACSSSPSAPDINQTPQAIGSPPPPPPPPPSGPNVYVKQISAGRRHTCGIGSGGKAYCWGRDVMGELGNGNNLDHAVVMPAGVSFTKISVGGAHTCALGSNNKAYCWGSNNWPSSSNYYDGELGQLGDGTYIHKDIPVPVSMPAGVTFTQVSAGWGHTCALDSNSKAYCWGDNGYSQLGNGFGGINSNIPVPVSMPAGVSFTKISAGNDHTCALGSNSKAYCWGNNYYRQLGNSTLGDINIDIPVPVSMPAGVGFTQIDAGGIHTCALGSNSKAYCWGSNVTWFDKIDSGQLGNGTYTNSNIPVPVSIPAGVSFTKISAGWNHTCALGSDSKAYCWGFSWGGQLGNGNGNKSNIPVAVSMPFGVSFTQISVDGHSCAMGSNSKAYCWGDNEYGELGNGTNNDSYIPVPTLPY